jgi:hypothetical protein
MKTHNPQNERAKRRYFTYLVEAKGFSEPTLDAVAKAINRFESYTGFRDFKAFHIEQAKGFKASLAGQMSPRSGDHLSKATLYATLSALKRFFIWLAGQPGYKSRISYSDAEYFNLSAKETRVAKARREERVPTLEQVRHVIHMMPANTEIERRDQALIAFTILTGARDRATAHRCPANGNPRRGSRRKNRPRHRSGRSFEAPRRNRRLAKSITAMEPKSDPGRGNQSSQPSKGCDNSSLFRRIILSRLWW